MTEGEYIPKEWDLTKDFCKGCFDYYPDVFTRYFDNPEHQRMFSTHCRRFECTIGKCYEFVRKLEAIREWAFQMECMYEDCTYMSHEQFDKDAKLHLENLIALVGKWVPLEMREGLNNLTLQESEAE